MTSHARTLGGRHRCARQFQDTSGLQYDIAVQLAHAHKSLTVVGASRVVVRALPPPPSRFALPTDSWAPTRSTSAPTALRVALAPLHALLAGDPDQSIYGWRNAVVSNLSARIFKEFGGNARTVRLSQGYRSTQAILNVAHLAIGQGMKARSQCLPPAAGGRSPTPGAHAHARGSGADGNCRPKPQGTVHEHVHRARTAGVLPCLAGFGHRGTLHCRGDSTVRPLDVASRAASAVLTAPGGHGTQRLSPASVKAEARGLLNHSDFCVLFRMHAQSRAIESGMAEWAAHALPRRREGARGE